MLTEKQINERIEKLNKQQDSHYKYCMLYYYKNITKLRKQNKERQKYKYNNDKEYKNMVLNKHKEYVNNNREEVNKYYRMYSKENRERINENKRNRDKLKCKIMFEKFINKLKVRQMNREKLKKMSENEYNELVKKHAEEIIEAYKDYIYDNPEEFTDSYLEEHSECFGPMEKDTGFRQVYYDDDEVAEATAENITEIDDVDDIFIENWVLENLKDDDENE